MFKKAGGFRPTWQSNFANRGPHFTNRVESVKFSWKSNSHCGRKRLAGPAFSSGTEFEAKSSKKVAGMW